MYTMITRKIAKPGKLSSACRINALSLTSPPKIGYMFGMTNLVFGSDQWKLQFNDPSGFNLNFLASSMAFGMLAGFVIYNSRIGKKIQPCTMLFYSNIVLVIGIILQVRSDTYWIFFAARLICGLGISLSNAAQSGISSKCTLPFHETIENSFMFLGVILGNIIAWPSKSPYLWRILSAYQLILPLLQIAVISISELPHLETQDSEHKTKKTSWITSKTIFWYSLAAIIIPILSTHIGGSILLTVICQLLEHNHGVDFKQQQISINSVLMIHHCISAIIKSFCKTDISNHRLLALCLMTTSVSVLTTATSYDVTLLNQTSLTLAAYVWIILIGLPTSYLTATVPELTSLAGFSSNLTALYNGFINPMIMSQMQWSRYGIGCLVGLVNWAVVGMVAVLYYTPSLHSIEAVSKHSSTVRGLE